MSMTPGGLPISQLSLKDGNPSRENATVTSWDSLRGFGYIQALDSILPKDYFFVDFLSLLYGTGKLKQNDLVSFRREWNEMRGKYEAKGIRLEVSAPESIPSEYLSHPARGNYPGRGTYLGRGNVPKGAMVRGGGRGFPRGGIIPRGGPGIESYPGGGRYSGPSWGVSKRVATGSAQGALLHRNPAASAAGLRGPGIRKMDPADGEQTSFHMLFQKYGDKLSVDQIEMYWESDCIPVSLTTADSDSDAQKIDPEDGQVYSFDEMYSKYSRAYSEQSIKSYWDMQCKPAPKTNARGESVAGSQDESKHGGKPDGSRSLQKRMLGEKLYPAVARLADPSLAGKITGMMLELDNSELLILLQSETQLRQKVDEALRVLQQMKTN